MESFPLKHLSKNAGFYILLFSAILFIWKFSRLREFNVNHGPGGPIRTVTQNPLVKPAAQSVFKDDRHDTRVQPIEHKDAKPIVDPQFIKLYKNNFPRITETPIADVLPHSDNFIWVETKNLPTNYSVKLQQLNMAVENLQVKLLKLRNNSAWMDFTKPIHVLWLNKDDAIRSLSNFSQVHTIVLGWGAGQNMPRETIYEWTATEPLCRYISTPGYTKARWDVVYNRTCKTNIYSSLVKKYLEPLYHHGKPINVRDYWPNNGLSYPPYFYMHYPDHSLYISVIEDGLVTQTGDVFSHNLKLVPYGCSQDVSVEPPSTYTSTPIYSELFVITQFWGADFFHRLLEVIPRLAPYLEFLRNNPHISIHASESVGLTAKLVRMLGLQSERLVSGLSRAKLIYLPRATPCGFARVQELQLMSDQLLSVNNQSLNRNLVILIHRSGLRHFVNSREIGHVVYRAAIDYGYQFYLFPDQPPPSIAETQDFFQRAVMIVAPHGAGLSNMVFSRPGTWLIEAVCNPPHVNMCYQWTAHILGHHYHAIPSRNGCEDHIDVEPALIDVTLRQYLAIINMTADTTL